MTRVEDVDLWSPPTPANLGAPKPRKRRHRHEWREDMEVEGIDPKYRCHFPGCGIFQDDPSIRRGRQSRKRGLSIQREVAAALEMEHIPGNGPADARDPRFVAEVKSGPSWYSVRVEAELDNLPTTGDRLPIFVAASTPGPGKGRRRIYVQVSLGDLVKMVGPHVQVAMWAPEWVALKHITEGKL